MLNLIKAFYLFQNIMTFNKCAIEGKSYGDPIDQYGNPMDVTDVSIKHRHTVKLMCTPFVDKNI